MKVLRTIANHVKLAFGRGREAVLEEGRQPAEPPPVEETTIRRQMGTKPDGTPIYVELRAGRLNGVMRQATSNDDADDA